MPKTNDTFRGAKLILFLGDRVLLIRRDLRDDIPWPGALDFPGGGRERNETPEMCVLRETREEVGLVLSEQSLTWRRERKGRRGISWFFAAHLPSEVGNDVRLGDEGTEWLLLEPQIVLKRRDMIPHFAEMLRVYLEDRDM